MRTISGTSKSWLIDHVAECNSVTQTMVHYLECRLKVICNKYWGYDESDWVYKKLMTFLNQGIIWNEYKNLVSMDVEHLEDWVIENMERFS